MIAQPPTTLELVVVVAFLVLLSSLVYLWPWDEDEDTITLDEVQWFAHFQVSDTMTLCGLDMEDYDGLDIGYLDDTTYPVTCLNCQQIIRDIAAEVREEVA